MDPADFTSAAWGGVHRTSGPHGYYAFFPHKIDRHLTLDPSTVSLQSKADLALGRLAGAGRILPNTAILLAPYALQESLDSSRIEGTQATLSEVFNANATGEAGEAGGTNVREVLNYRAAMDHGLNSGLPLSKRLLTEMHRVRDTAPWSRRPPAGEPSRRSTSSWRTPS